MDNNQNTHEQAQETGTTQGNDNREEQAVLQAGGDIEERGKWNKKSEYFLACVGYVTGLTNVSRFPFSCYNNGGVYFLIPYLLMLFFVGMPLVCLELSLGQYTSSSPLKCWEMAPIFKGVGVAMVILSTSFAIYYNMLIGWAIFYLCTSFTSEFPWEHCGEDWASHGCIFPSGYYLRKHAWRVTTGSDFEYFGDLDWRMVLCLMAAWTLVTLTLSNGVKSYGKVVYFTVLCPYVALIILFVWGLTLNGAREEIEYLLYPNRNRLRDWDVWREAGAQAIFSLSVSWGGLITLGSYNYFHNDVIRDSFKLTLINSLTSFVVGIVIFSCVGFLAHELGGKVGHVTESGDHLAFVVIPAAIAKMPVSPLWAILFFLMMITMGLNFMFGLVATVTTSIMDQFPKTRKRKWVIVLGCSMIMFFLGLTFCTKGQPYWLLVMDNHIGGLGLYGIAIMEYLCMFIYGLPHFWDDVRTMTGYNFSFNKIWIPVTRLPPIGLLFLFVCECIKFYQEGAVKYRILFTTWARGLAWFLIIVPFLAIILTAVLMVIFTPGECYKKFETVLRPTRFWGPALPQHRELVHHLGTDFQVIPWEQADTTSTDIQMETDVSNNT